MGVVIGVSLSWAYVQFGATLPYNLGWAGNDASDAVLVTAERKLYDPNAEVDVRKRALADMIGQQPDLFLEIDAALPVNSGPYSTSVAVK